MSNRPFPSVRISEDYARDGNREGIRYHCNVVVRFFKALQDRSPPQSQYTIMNSGTRYEPAHQGEDIGGLLYDADRSMQYVANEIHEVMRFQRALTNDLDYAEGNLTRLMSMLHQVDMIPSDTLEACKTWCRDNIKGKWSYKTGGHHPYVSFVFVDDKDAALFKLFHA